MDRSVQGVIVNFGLKLETFFASIFARIYPKSV